MNFSDFCENQNITSDDKNVQKGNYQQFRTNSANLKNQANNNQNLQKNAINNKNFNQNNKIYQNETFENDIKNKLSEYKNMSASELQSELLKEAARQKQNGNLSSEKLNEIELAVAPMLNEEQRNRLEEIIKMLR